MYFLFIENTLSIKFPYLNTPGMHETERRRLIRRLRSETDDMKRKFAILVCRTMDHLKEKRKNVEDLIVLLATLNERDGNRITKKLRKKSNVNKAFLALNKFWSFFECEFHYCQFLRRIEDGIRRIYLIIEGILQTQDL